MYRFALTRLGRDADAAEEVVQEALSRAVLKLETYRGEAALFTWLCTFCRHEVSAYLRRKRRAGREVELAEESPDVQAALESLAAVLEADPEESVLRREVARLVQVALDHLPARYASTLEWKYVEGLSVREIATRSRMTEKAVESLLSRARVAFREGFTSLTRDLEAVPRPQPVSP